MTAVSVASFLQEVLHPAHDVRRMTQSMFAGRGGVVPRTPTFTDMKVTQRGAGANMSVDVAEGSCLVTGTESTYQGLYHCENHGVQNVTISAADATNPRRDLIVARIKDTEYGVAVTDVFEISPVTGTPAGSPADPTVPANCIVLARVAVAASATSITNANITDLRNGYAAVTGSAVIGNQVKACSLGGVAVCTSSFRPTVALYEGMVAYETDTGRLIRYDGTNWIAMPTCVAATIDTAQATTSTGYTDLATVGPSVSLLTGAKAVVLLGAQLTNSSTDGTYMSLVISGATTLAASDVYSYSHRNSDANYFTQGSAICYFSTLTPGVNTFTAKYRVGASTGTFANRRIVAMTSI